MTEESKLRLSIGTRILQSKFTRGLALVAIAVTLVSLLRKISRPFQGEFLSWIEIVEEAGIIILFTFAFFAGSKGQRIKSFFSRGLILILMWLYIFVFTLVLISPPLSYWLVLFFIVMLLTHYLVRWYSGQRREKAGDGPH